MRNKKIIGYLLGLWKNMEKHYFIEPMSINAITGDKNQVEIHMDSGECFKISSITIEKCYAILKTKMEFERINNKEVKIKCHGNEVIARVIQSEGIKND